MTAAVLLFVVVLAVWAWQLYTLHCDLTDLRDWLARIVGLLATRPDAPAEPDEVAEPMIPQANWWRQRN